MSLASSAARHRVRRCGLNAQTLFENPDQVLQFTAACTFLGEVVSQLLYLPFECVVPGAWRRGWACRNGIWGKQLRRLRGGMEHRCDEPGGFMNWLAGAGMNGHHDTDIAGLRQIGHFAGMQLLAGEGNLRSPSAIVDFNFASI